MKLFEKLSKVLNECEFLFTPATHKITSGSPLPFDSLSSSTIKEEVETARSPAKKSAGSYQLTLGMLTLLSLLLEVLIISLGRSLTTEIGGSR